MAITRHYWQSGDGQDSAEKNPVFVYRMPGIYTARHTAYDDERGVSATATKEITVTEWAVGIGALKVSRTNRCYAFALNAQQGVGFRELSGSGFPYPEGKVGVLKMLDSNSQPHTLVLKNSDGRFYDISTRKGPSGSGLTRATKDSELTDGSGGTDIVPVVTFAEDRGTKERYFISHKESHIYVRPYDDTKRGESGFDAEGYPTGLELNLAIYKDGELSDAEATIDDIPFDGDLHFDRKVEGHREYLKSTGNMGGHIIVGRDQQYKRVNRAAAPSSREMSTDDYQREFSTPVLWPCYIGGTLYNRYSGDEIDPVGTDTKVTAPTGEANAAMSFTDTMQFGSQTLPVGGTLVLWYRGTITVTIGGTTVALTDHGVSGAWTLAYLRDSGSEYTGALSVVPTGLACLFDMRLFNTAITTDGLAYYYDDVKNNSGNIMAPRGY